MQFVKDGPDIPEKLLQAHEDGQVAFFCGAGISYPAKLPGFGGLVRGLYEELKDPLNAVQRAAIQEKRFDTAIALLERDVAGGRQTVRKAVAKILTPDLGAPGATTTHEALLRLSRNPEGRTRLITTNFDRLFEEVIGTNPRGPKRFQAPLLPVPKNRWDGLVYLHGLLEAEPDKDNLESLVLSSGDFGLAYLNERWAARFVSELFRNFTVCFVGYSIDDPVLRYMMDALAADKMLGESSPDMFAFGYHSKRKQDETAEEWEAKNVTPILYQAHRHHAHLHRTLRVWADTYRVGVLGKEHIVEQCATSRPRTSTKQDDFVGRIVWALSDRSGLPAKRFAEMNPIPSLEWLEPLSDDRFDHADLVRFGVPPKPEPDNRMRFSLTERPAPYDRAPRMALVRSGPQASGWDDTMWHLARWLIRHLDDPELLLWIVKQGGAVHEELLQAIAGGLNHLVQLEEAGDSDGLDRIRANAPNAIPRPHMRTLWGLLLSRRMGVATDDLNLYGWRARFKRHGLTPGLRLELREQLTPRVRLRKPFPRSFGADRRGEPERLSDLVNVDIVLSASDVHRTLGRLRDNEHWREALPDLLSDFSMLLRDTLELMREVQMAGEKDDLGHIWQPSISEHPQNKKLRDWTALIDLTRDAWVAMANRSRKRAQNALEEWRQISYPVFRRLVLFAATHTETIRPETGVTYLLEDERWWLWLPTTKREAVRLLVRLAPELDRNTLGTLEEAILEGPPREMYREDLEREQWTRICKSDIGLRFAKMVQAGAELNAGGNEFLRELRAEFPQWSLAEDERDEFPRWSESGWGPREVIATPPEREALLEWVRKHPERDDWKGDDWQQRCRENFDSAVWVLRRLAREGTWPPGRWQEALYAWTDENLTARSWHEMASVLQNASDENLKTLTDGVSWWLRGLARSFEGQEDAFFALCRRTLALDEGPEEANRADEVVQRAINEAVGRVTEALIHWWQRRDLHDGQGLPDKVKPTFTQLCDTQVNKFRGGRALLAGEAIALFRVDAVWTTEHLLPLFDWNRSEVEARGAWEGYLWSGRMYAPLMERLKGEFAKTAEHYDALGSQGRPYVWMLTFAALEPSDVFTARELRNATRALPQEGLNEAAETVARSLESAGDRRSEHWKESVAPYLCSVWPNRNDRRSRSIAEHLGRVCVAAERAFPDALELVEAWLQPLRYTGLILEGLLEAGICDRFPEEALKFLDALGDDQTGWSDEKLQSCLIAIRAAAPELEDDPRFIRLRAYLRRHGRDLD